MEEIHTTPNGDAMPRNINVNDKIKIINELINYAIRNKGFSTELINELNKIVTQITTQSNAQCSKEGLEKLHHDLVSLPSNINVRLQMFMYLLLGENKARDLSRKLEVYSERLKNVSDERLLDPQYKNAIELEFTNLCNFIKNMTSDIESAMPKGMVNGFTNALNAVMGVNAWFNACMNNDLTQLFQNYVNCVQLMYVQGLSGLVDENVLEFVQNHTGIPVNVIQHKPIKYMMLEFENTNFETSVEAIELLYSLLPFTLYKKDHDYFIFIPDEKHVEGYEHPEAKIIVPYRIKLQKVSDKDIRWTWKKKGKQPSTVFMINDKAIKTRQGSSTYVCILGYVPITTSAKCENYNCPLWNRCFDPSSKTFKYLKPINDSYMRIYNINLSISKNAYLIRSKPLLINPVIINGSVNRGIEMSIDNAWVLLSIDKAIFMPRERYRWLFIREPELSIRIRSYKLGLKLLDSKAFVLRFNKNVIKNIISNLLRSNRQVSNYICLKYKASKGGDEYLYSRILNAADMLMKGDGCDLENDDFINYGVRVFAHTLAHVLLTFLSARLQVEPSRTLDYYYDIDDEYVTVAVYELGEGGLGLLERETLISVFPGLNILDELLNHVKIMHDKCEDRISKQISIGNSYINNIINNQALRSIWDKYVFNAYNSHKIIINAQTLRIPVWNLVSSNQSSNQGNQVNLDDAQDFLANVPICMDACNYCVMLEKGCSDPLNQIVTTSRSLLYHVLSELKKLVDDTQRDVNSTLLNPSRDRLDLFLKLLGLATRSIKIMTYVIDDHMADRLIEIKGNRNLSVKVIIDRRKLNESETIKSKLVGNGIEVKSLDNLHAKVYIIDDALVLEGSMNLTVKGLVENTENIELKTNPLDVYQFVENFDEAWKNAS